MTEGTIASLTPTLCDCFHAPAPGLAGEPALRSVAAHRQGILNGAAVERCLVYCPDALGDHVWRRFPGHAAAVAACCPHRVRLLAAFPPVTPVCYTSVFTGAQPESHGIRRSERPVLACDTLFDALARAGRRIAIVAVRRSSIDLMFRGRPLDYFSEPCDDRVTARVLALLEADDHHLVVAYHQDYDDRLHESQPFSDAAVRAIGGHVAALTRLSRAVATAWSRRRRMVVVAPDHGAHVDEASGRGNHGLHVPEDMEVSHWYRFSDASRAGAAPGPGRVPASEPGSGRRHG